MPFPKIRQGKEADRLGNTKKSKVPLSLWKMGNTKKESREETYEWGRWLSHPTIKEDPGNHPAGEIPPESMIRSGKWQEKPGPRNDLTPSLGLTVIVGPGRIKL